MNNYYEKTKKYYNKIGNLCGVYSNYPFLIEGFKFNTNLTKHFEEIINIAGINDNQNILEAGCGFGGALKNLSLLCPKNEYIGITLVESHLLKKQYNNIRVENFDKTSFADLSFDRILFIESFSHSFNKYNTFKEVYRLLKPGGICFILDLSVTNEFYKECGINKQARAKYKGHINFFGDKPICYNYMRKLIHKSGFTFITGKERAHNVCSIKDTLLNKAIERIILTKKLDTFYNWYLFKKI